MADEEGAVIACDTKEKFEANMARGKETGKLVRARFQIPTLSLFSRSFCPNSC
jgi:hypothetical protein